MVNILELFPLSKNKGYWNITKTEVSSLNKHVVRNTKRMSSFSMAARWHLKQPTKADRCANILQRSDVHYVVFSKSWQLCEILRTCFKWLILLFHVSKSDPNWNHCPFPTEKQLSTIPILFSVVEFEADQILRHTYKNSKPLKKSEMLTRPKTKIPARKLMVGRLLSVWGPAYFQGLCWKYRFLAKFWI